MPRTEPSNWSGILKPVGFALLAEVAVGLFLSYFACLNIDLGWLASMGCPAAANVATLIAIAVALLAFPAAALYAAFRTRSRTRVQTAAIWLVAAVPVLSTVLPLFVITHAGRAHDRIVCEPLAREFDRIAATSPPRFEIVEIAKAAQPGRARVTIRISNWPKQAANGSFNFTALKTAAGENIIANGRLVRIAQNADGLDFHSDDSPESLRTAPDTFAFDVFFSPYSAAPTGDVTAAYFYKFETFACAFSVHTGEATARFPAN